MSINWAKIKLWCVGALAVGGCAGTRIAINFGDDPEQSVMVMCSALTLLGTFLGMLGATNLFWSPSAKAETIAKANEGDTAAAAILRNKESQRDTLTAFGWASVFAGAIGLLLWYIFCG